MVADRVLGNNPPLPAAIGGCTGCEAMYRAAIIFAAYTGRKDRGRAFLPVVLYGPTENKKRAVNMLTKCVVRVYSIGAV